MVNQGHNKSILRLNAYRAHTSLKVVQGHYKLVKPVLKATWFKKTRNQNRSNRFDHNVIFLFEPIPSLILLAFTLPSTYFDSHTVLCSLCWTPLAAIVRYSRVERKTLQQTTLL